MSIETDEPAGRTRVKICCIASEAEAAMAAGAGADLLGLVGPMPSGPGILALEDVARIVASVPPWAQPVLLTEGTTAAAVAQDAAQAGVSAVQVVQHLAVEEAEALAAMPLLYVQVVHIEDAGALDLAAVYGPHCDAFLLDSGRPAEGVLGGTGQVHDWALSARFVEIAAKPVFLAGGLTPQNVGEAIATVRPFGLDLCTGVRGDGAPGAAHRPLCPARLAAFMRAVATADAR
ncbi:MAG: phosphoribosylanthranilate isomerase [Pseudomonadota bacterium]